MGDDRMTWHAIIATKPPEWHRDVWLLRTDGAACLVAIAGHARRCGRWFVFGRGAGSGAT